MTKGAVGKLFGKDGVVGSIPIGSTTIIKELVLSR